MSLVAGLLVGLTLLLARPAAVHVRPPARTLTTAPWLPLLLTAVAAALLSQVVHGTRLVAGLIALFAAVAVHRLVVRARQTHAADRLADLVVGALDGIAADLRAGQTPEAALDRAAGEWRPLGSAASAARLGGDVPGVLRDLAAQPGAESLRTVAAAWQVSHRSGSGLAAALGQTVRSLREQRRTSRMVASELASARATAHIMAALPVGVLMLGSGVGGDPIGFLLDTTVGLGCLALGAALALTGLFWLQHISDGVQGR